jgi:hypothetical protein
MRGLYQAAPNVHYNLHQKSGTGTRSIEKATIRVRTALAYFLWRLNRKLHERTRTTHFGMTFQDVAVPRAVMESNRAAERIAQMRVGHVPLSRAVATVITFILFRAARPNKHDMAAIPEFRGSRNAAFVCRAQRSPSPVVLLFFDTDTDHGRYLRLGTLPTPRAGEKAVTVRPGLDAVIKRERLEKLIAALRSGAAARGRIIVSLGQCVTKPAMRRIIRQLSTAVS